MVGLAVAPDGRRCLSAGLDGTFRLWDLASGRELQRFAGSPASSRSVGFSRDGRLAILISDLPVPYLLLWDHEAGRIERYLGTPRQRILCAAVAPEQHLAVSGEHGRLLRLWDLTSGKELCRFQGQTQDGLDIAFTPDGRFVLAADRDHQIRTWLVPKITRER